jgi:hypothetical protein
VDEGMGRRTFLVAVASGTASLVGLRRLSATGRAAPGASPAGTVVVEGTIRAPGDVIAVEWPASLDAAEARFIHRVDGRTVAIAPVPPPAQGSVPTVRFVAEPGGGLPPGAHEFALEASGKLHELGGFRVAPFVFGC